MPRRRITFRQLETFSAVARLQSFTRAAEALHLTQPAISIQIRQIVEAIGLPLFEQNGREVALTAAGEEMLATVRELDDVWNRFESAIDDLKGFKRGNLRCLDFSCLEFSQVTLNARLDFRYLTLQFGAREIPVTIIDGLEIAAIDSHQRLLEKNQLLAHHILPADLADYLANNLAKIDEGLVVKHQTPGERHQFYVALGFPL